MQQHSTAPASPKRPAVTTNGGFGIKTGVKAGLGWSGIFFGGVYYPR